MRLWFFIGLLLFLSFLWISGVFSAAKGGKVMVEMRKNFIERAVEEAVK